MASANMQSLTRQRELEIREIMRQATTPEPTIFGRVLRRGDIIESGLFWVFVAGLAWVPYWYGSNLLATWGVNAVLFPGLAALYEISLAARGAPHPVAIKAIRIPAALFFAVAIWILIQNSTWTPALLHHPIWGMAADELQTPVDGSISVNRDLTTLALLRLLTAASVLWLAIQLCRNASRAIQFMIAFVAISSAYAAYGLITFASMQSENASSLRFENSTFYNHNHYATYAGMGLIAVFGLIARVYQRDMVTDGGTLRFRIATFIDVTGQRALALLVAAFSLLVAVILTESRGGIIATGFGVVVWATLTFRRSQSASIERRLVIIFLCAVVAAVFVGFGDTFVGKIAEVGLADSNRIGVYLITLRSILDQPLVGYGYGTFADLFPMFRERSVDVQGIWEQAHNTYLEVFQGLGLLFGCMLVASVVVLIVKCYKGAVMRQQITVPAIAVGVAFLVGTHAMVDFSLQIQAVTLTFMAILGAGIAQSESSRLALND
jgi:O-antigen ligase